jgi:hypothetical protein
MCQQCNRLYHTENRAISNNRICVRCEATNNGAYTAGWEKKSELVGTTYNLIKSARRFGIEIETAQCKHVDRIQGKTLFGAKYDATITGKEFDSPILSGDEGLVVVHHFCDMAKRRGWKVDERCGTHIHLDMSQEGALNLRSIAIAYLYTYQSWAKLVHPNRLNNNHCMPPTYDADCIMRRAFTSAISRIRRYQFINIAAYLRHKTFEIRGLEGTLDKKLLTNWIIAHLTFADFCATLSVEQVNRLFNQPELICWDNLKTAIGDTARYFGHRRAKQTKICV